MVIAKFTTIIVLFCFFHYGNSTQFTLNLTKAPVAIVVDDSGSKIEYRLMRDDKEIQKVILATEVGGTIQSRSTSNGLIIIHNSIEIEFRIEVDESKFSEISVSRRNIQNPTRDCVDLASSSEVNWFGGNQQFNQNWPIQKHSHSHYSWVTKEENANSIMERYWLNSNGVFFFVDQSVPLFLDQNNEDQGFMCFEVKRDLPYDTTVLSFDFTYRVGVGENAKDTHLEAVVRHLKKPTGYPDERMVRDPIWSTWARYKAFINESVVLQFAKEIRDNNFKDSQLEIDDFWEPCYGALTFDTNKFPNIKQTTDALKAQGFRVTVWIHPFINIGCEPWFSEAKANGYFVKTQDESTQTRWWTTNLGAGHIDFTNPAAKEWFSNRVRKLLTDSGVDSVKFDAGETSWWPSNPKLNGPSNLHPTLLTSSYMRAVSEFGNMIEVRTGQGTQDLPIFVRMLDKDSEWTMRHGLPTLITTMLQMNMVGYGFVLPDMVGGNGYGAFWGDTEMPTKELFIRWLQTNTFMPGLQYSFVPWDYDAETIQISKKFTDLHSEYSDMIIERFKLAVKSGEPVNPPIWWVDPTDKTAQGIDDQFLLGETILVAPIVKQGAVKRDVYLPNGKWKDGNSETIHDGGKWIRDYSAPLDTLPYFIKSGVSDNLGSKILFVFAVIIVKLFI